MALSTYKYNSDFCIKYFPNVCRGVMNAGYLRAADWQTIDNVPPNIISLLHLVLSDLCYDCEL